MQFRPGRDEKGRSAKRVVELLETKNTGRKVQGETRRFLADEQCRAARQEKEHKNKRGVSRSRAREYILPL